MFPFGGILRARDRTLLLTVLLVNHYTEQSPATAEARLGSSGVYQERTGGAGGWTAHESNQWIHGESQQDPGFDPSLYEGGYFSVTGDTDDLTGSPLDTYLSLVVTRAWTEYRAGVGINQVVGTIKVREIANPSNEVTAQLTLKAENDSGM